MTKKKPIAMDLSKFPTYEVSPHEVYVREDRHRKLFDKKKMDELISSIKAIGQLQPGLCTINEEGRLELIIGERRLRACGALERPFFYLLKEQLDPFTLELMQLDENIRRDDLDWKEAVFAKERVHKLFQTKFGESKAGSADGHSLADTAEYLSESKTTIHEDISLAIWAREIPEVAAAPNKTTAKKIVERLTQTVKREASLDAAIAKGKESEALTEASTAASSEPPEGLSTFEKRLLEYDRRILLGKMEDRLVDFKDETFDVVLFDPPWGVALNTNFKNEGNLKMYEDEECSFDEGICHWLKLIYSKMKPNSHLYMFFGIRFHEKVYSALNAAGFETHRIPLIWYKKGAHSIRNPKKWPGLSYEPIAFARKGNKPLVLMGEPDVIITPLPSPSLKGIHPSAKHPLVYRNLIERSAEPGNSILDPMAGSGMAGVAADSLFDRFALDWWLIELDSDYRNLAISNLMKGYWDLVGSPELAPSPSDAKAFGGNEAECSYLGKYEEPTLPSSFQVLVPGSEDWRRWWKLHPEDQEAMLAWKEAKEPK